MMHLWLKKGIIIQDFCNCFDPKCRWEWFK